ncbi:MAG TPA: septal ring lytic transglycosylase RlpA family protein [Verrucomicrobiae bacterium]|jgi:rare lipoprotein A|nr:septal ring lytic transglycosylase RlpA family protein [Verrucomicrobiae bacterium]
MQRRIAHGLALAFLFASLGAAQGPNNSEATPAPNSSSRQKTAVRKQVGKSKPYQVGTASWYGEYFEGKPTASGEPYDMYDMTAASLTIPLGTYVKVTNLRNGKAVVVRVNDRGPIIPGRIIDVSYQAARVLQFKNKGLQRVRLDLVNTTEVAKDHNTTPLYQTVAFNHPPVAQLP